MNGFMKLVSDMRAAQKMFFATRGKPEAKMYLIESKRLEKEVDTMLIQMENEKDKVGL